jgi:putative ABC transport system substrate-binding protein
VRRREFITLLGSAVVLCTPTARAQQHNRPTIGFLAGDATVWRPWTAAFVNRLGELGWLDGQTIQIDYGWWEGHADRAAEIAADYVRRKVDVIVANADAVPAVKKATATIPIVFVLSQDPVSSGLVSNLAHPTGNVTGLSIQSTDLAGKRFELLREIVPTLRRLAVMGNPSISQAAVEMDQVRALARTMDIEIQPLDIRRGDDIMPALESLNGRADAIYVVVDALIAVNRSRIVTFVLNVRLPTMFNNRVHVQAGGLMSYGPNFSDQYGRAAELVDKILHGTKPSDIPVEQPTKFELVINETTAQKIGLSIPHYAARPRRRGDRVKPKQPIRPTDGSRQHAPSRRAAACRFTAILVTFHLKN